MHVCPFALTLIVVLIVGFYDLVLGIGDDILARWNLWKTLNFRDVVPSWVLLIHSETLKLSNCHIMITSLAKTTFYQPIMACTYAQSAGLKLFLVFGTEALFALGYLLF